MKEKTDIISSEKKYEEEQNELSKEQSLLDSKILNYNIQNLNTIINLMSLEFSLSDLAELIESETGGLFTFKQLYDIINKQYKKLTKKDKKDLIKYLPLSLLNINLENPYIELLSLFNYFSELLGTKINSPSLILYEISKRLKEDYKKSTVEFFVSNNIEISGKINLKRLIELFHEKLKIDENEVRIFYDIMNYDNENEIKIENIILTIDSFRDDNNNDILNEKDKSILFSNIIFDKIFLDIDKLFQEGKTEYIEYSELKNKILEEINNNNEYLNKNENIDEVLLDNIFKLILKEDKLYYKEYKSALFESIYKLKNNKIKLTVTQKYWLNRYVDKLLSKSIEPKELFKESNSIKLKDIKKLLLKLSFSINDINNIINALDINNDGIINNVQYKIIINFIMKEKESIMKLNYPSESSNKNEEIDNMWEYGITPDDYYYLPIKGNIKILNKRNKKIKYKSPNKKNNNEIKLNIKYQQNKKIKKIEQKEYSDEYYLKFALENFDFNKNKFTCFNLYNHLLKNDFSSKYSLQIIKLLDKDYDGYIDIIDLILFLLFKLKYKSTKLVFKYLYIKIYKELNFESSEKFLKEYNLDLNELINDEKFIKFMKEFNIDFPLTKQILYEMNIIYPQPLLYRYISEQIDFYKKDKIINNLQFSEKENENKNYNIKTFEREMENNIIKENIIKNKLNSILEKCNDTMNYQDYLIFFSKPLDLDEFFALIIFQLLKSFSPNGEQIVSKNDLLMFFESYSLNKKENKSKNKDIKEIIKYIKKIGAPLKYAFEIIPFRKNGLIPSSELIKYLSKFYGERIPKNDLINIVFFIDKKKKGIISYEQIQIFLNKYCKDYSDLIELQVIACNIYKYNYNNAEEFFNQNKFEKIIENEDSINKKQHNLILKNMCSNSSNKENLFIYLSKNGKNYNVKRLFDLLNIYLGIDSNINNEGKENFNENALPNKSMVENILKEINIGENGNISLNEFIMKFKIRYRKQIISKLDNNKKGFISFPQFISQIITIYGTDIDLNYKLCAQYLYSKYIKDPDKIRKYIIKKANVSSIKEYISYKTAYNNFMFAFCNNKILFETFYMIYKEKRGSHNGMLKLSNLEQFIIINNNLINQKTNELLSEENIISILSKYMITIKELINVIDIEQSNLDKNFIIKENYIRNILKTELDFIDKDIDLICKTFNEGEDKFNLRKFFMYENKDIINYDIILYDEILPKIRKKIKKSKINSYKEYKLKIFNNIDYLDICELFSKFNKLYNISLYNCLLIIKNENYFSTEKFFTETNLKDEFKIKDLELSLKLALIKLNDFFKINKDKIKVFKEFDLNRDGKLSPDEFITALNSLENLDLNDNQKYKILNVIDTNKDGNIDINEFLKFIKNLDINNNNNGEINNINSTLFKKKIDLNEIPSIESQEISNTDRNQIQNNINYNKNKLKQNNNVLLNYIIILQENILFKKDIDSIEKEFINESSNNAIISEKKFKNILKKKLANIKNENLNKLIDLINNNNENKENVNGKINYQNFLKNLINFRFENIKDSDNDDIILPKIN